MGFFVGFKELCLGLVNFSVFVFALLGSGPSCPLCWCGLCSCSGV